MKNYRNAFTLVELVVVVTILAVLSTVGFVAFSGYLEGVRDTNRITQLKSLSDGLITYQAGNPLPMPDDYVEIRQGTKIVGYQGYAGDNIISKIEYSSEGIDPKDGVYFTYSLSKNRKYFSLMAFLEEENLLEGISLLNTSYAVNYANRFPYMTGKKVGILINDTNVPIQEDETIKTAGFIDITSLAVPYQLYLSNNEIYTGSGSELVNLSPNYDCKRLQDMRGKLQDGIYPIDPDGDGITTNVYCDMTTDGGGWTFTTMLADTTTQNLFSETNANNTQFITSLTKGISTKGKLSNVWTNNANRDILLQCFSDNIEHIKYKDPFIIYNFSGTEKTNLTKQVKQSTPFASTYLDAKWKNQNFTLNTTYRSGSANDMRIQDSTGKAVFLLMDDQLATENSTATWVNINSPAYDSTTSKYTNLGATTYCVSAIR